MPFKYNALLGLGLDNTIPLDGAGKIPATYLPSYVDDVEEYNNLAAFPATGETGKIYVAIDTGFVYRWSGSIYVQIGVTAAAGSTTQVQFNDGGAFGGDAGLVFDKTTDALTIAGPVVHPLGAAATPSLTFTGDPNTGIYSPGADQLAISTAGTGRLFVDASGNVGVGTSTITGRLSLGASQDFVFGNQSSTGTGGTGRLVATGGEVYVQAGLAATAGSNAPIIFTGYGGVGERMRLTSAGLVGLGTSAPQAELNVAKVGGASTVYIESDAGNNATTSILRFGGASGRSASIQGFRGASSNIQSLDFYTYNSADVFGMRLTSTGLGIGTTSPSNTLTVNGNAALLANGELKFADSTSARVAVIKNGGGASTSQLDFLIGETPTLAMRLDSSSRLLVGTSTAFGSASNDSNYSLIQVKGNTAGGGSEGRITLGSTTASASIVAGNDLGSIWFADGSGGDYARILAEADGTAGSGDYPGRLVFSTTADGAASPTERLRITSAGVLQVADAGNITVGTTTGTKIGTATTQKIGFYNATPVVQPAAVADATTAVDVITQLNDLLAKLRTLGIIAT